MNEELEDLLRELRSWLRDLGYKAPEVIQQDREYYMERITALLGE